MGTEVVDTASGRAPGMELIATWPRSSFNASAFESSVSSQLNDNAGLACRALNPALRSVISSVTSTSNVVVTRIFSPMLDILHARRL